MTQFTAFFLLHRTSCHLTLLVSFWKAQSYLGITYDPEEACLCWFMMQAFFRKEVKVKGSKVVAAIRSSGTFLQMELGHSNSRV